MNKKITNFTHHLDGVNEIISAKDINALQDAINESEKIAIGLADEQFRQKAFFALESSLFANTLFLDELENPYKVLMAKSENIVFNSEDSSISIRKDGNIKEGVMSTIKLEPQNATAINEFSIVVDHYIPKGAAIRYFISNDGISYYPIKANISEPTVLKNKGSAAYLKAILYKNKNYESPKIFGWSVLYRDPIIDRKYGLKNIDLSRLDSTAIGETVLYRNPDNGDRLEIIIDPDTTTELFYEDLDPNGEPRLSHIITRADDRVFKDTMNYGNYTNSNGEVENVLLSISTTLVREEDIGGENR